MDNMCICFQDKEETYYFQPVVEGIIMLRVKIKRYICAALSILICLGSTSCGKHLTVVDEYGRQDDSSGNTTQLSTGGDAYYEQSGGENIQDIFGPSISWRDDFTVGDIPVKVSAYYDVPDIDGVNVFHNKKISDGLDQEDAIVKSLFGLSDAVLWVVKS